jgi:hypothetical protein
VEYLESRLKFYEESDYLESYMSIKKVVDHINLEIKNSISDVESKGYESVTKHAEKLPKFLAQLESFKAKMSPADRKSVEKRMQENAGLAEKIALSEKNGTNRTV